MTRQFIFCRIACIPRRGGIFGRTHLFNQQSYHFHSQRALLPLYLRNRAVMSTACASNIENVTPYQFGPWPIQPSEIFAVSPLSFAFVNLKPVVPGHVLVSPKRVVDRFSNLTLEETNDLWLLSQRVGNVIESHYKASSLTLTIQDGPQAGQTVPHVHVHILPRRQGDFERNDDIYDAIDNAEKEFKVDLEEDRKPRTGEEMAEEASQLRPYFS